MITTCLHLLIIGFFFMLAGMLAIVFTSTLFYFEVFMFLSIVFILLALWGAVMIGLTYLVTR